MGRMFFFLSVLLMCVDAYAAGYRAALVADMDTGRVLFQEKANELRTTHTHGKISTKIQGIYYYASDPSKYVEAPINVVVSKTRLSFLADAHYEITKNGFIRHTK